MRYTIILALTALFIGCSEAPEKPKAPVEEELVVVENGIFKQYYPGKKQLKFYGQQDENEQRHGVWKHFGETGLELGMTEYRHGIKNGLTVVKYPNGALHYTGEYENDKKIGIWRTYDEQGKLVEEIDLGGKE